jgi:DegV family protein with EDD domain
MEEYQIITESTSDLTQEMVDELGVELIPMSFTLGKDSYFDYADERELSSHEFYGRIAAGETSTTNQITLTVFTETFEKYLQAGKDVLYIGFSSSLSGTYNNSVLVARELAEKYPNRKIYTADTLGASLGEGVLVWNAVQMQRAGASIDEVKKWVEENRNRVHHWFTVDDLNHLKRGGRISGAAAMMGTMLGIKPVMHFDDNGCIVLVDKVRGRKQSLDALIKHMEITGENIAEQTIFISHSDSLEGAEYVRDEVAKKFGVKNFRIAPIGPVIGAHTGTGTVALFYFGKDREAEQKK